MTQTKDYKHFTIWEVAANLHNQMSEHTARNVTVKMLQVLWFGCPCFSLNHWKARYKHQTNGTVTLQWTHLYFVRLLSTLKHLLHMLHIYGPTLSWMWLCLLRLLRSLNTFLQFDTTVNAFVWSQMTGLGKCFLTDVTCVRFDTTVDALVYIETNKISECFLANVTHVRFHTALNTFVYTQVRVLSKCFLTNVKTHMV